jgi:hypothetical protein
MESGRIAESDSSDRIARGRNETKRNSRPTAGRRSPRRSLHRHHGPQHISGLFHGHGHGSLHRPLHPFVEEAAAGRGVKARLRRHTPGRSGLDARKRACWVAGKAAGGQRGEGGTGRGRDARDRRCDETSTSSETRGRWHPSSSGRWGNGSTHTHTHTHAAPISTEAKQAAIRFGPSNPSTSQFTSPLSSSPRFHRTHAYAYAAFVRPHTHVRSLRAARSDRPRTRQLPYGTELRLSHLGHSAAPSPLGSPVAAKRCQ